MPTHTSNNATTNQPANERTNERTNQPTNCTYIRWLQTKLLRAIHFIDGGPRSFRFVPFFDRGERNETNRNESNYSFICTYYYYYHPIYTYCTPCLHTALRYKHAPHRNADRRLYSIPFFHFGSCPLLQEGWSGPVQSRPVSSAMKECIGSDTDTDTDTVSQHNSTGSCCCSILDRNKPTHEGSTIIHLP
mmetsp:Transcript_20365/g.43074  ORF Transcript_20365/g.43074 Transcript_20365/m.43074 type:complete len:190 (-) Transcript_20365:710-1279(-)